MQTDQYILRAHLWTPDGMVRLGYCDTRPTSRRVVALALAEMLDKLTQTMAPTYSVTVEVLPYKGEEHL